MNTMYVSSRVRLLIISFFSFLIIITIFLPRTTKAYYSYGGLYGSNYTGSGSALGYNQYSNLGGLYGGIGGLYGGLGGMYGMSSLYGGLGGLYGMSSLYGGLGGMYGMSSLYGGLGGLYGMSSLYGGLGGMYGMSSLYGGLGGLYGMSSLYGGLGGLYGGIGGLGGLRYGLAEQFGTWEGTWSTASTKSVVYATGPITLNIIEDPVVPGLVTGYIQLAGNPVLTVLVEVTGEIINDQIILSGSGLGIGSQTIQIELVCTLVSPTEMTGVYTQINSSSIIGTGAFEATLLTPVI